MAKEISTTLRINDQASNTLRSVANNARSTAKTMQTAGQAMDKAFNGKASSSFASQIQRAAQQAMQALGGIGETASSAGAAVDDFQEEFQNGFANGFADSFAKEFGKAFDDAISKADDLTDSMENLGDVDVDGSGIKDVGDEADQAGSHVDNLSRKTESLGDMLKKVGAIIAGLAIADKIKDYGQESIETFKTYESGMAEVYTLLPDATQQEIDALGEGARELSVQTGASIEGVTSAMYQAISASVPQDEVLSFLKTANMAAVGGVTDMETAVDGITSVINAYGTDVLSATQASDAMFTAVKLGKTTFDEMAGSLYNVVPTAVGAGVSFNDVTGAIAAMTAQGVPTSVATTQLRQAIVELADSGTDVGKKFKEVSGKTFRDFIKSGGNLNKAFDLMKGHADKLGIGVNELFGSVEAGNAVLSLSGQNSELFARDIKAMEDSTGATETAYEKMANTMEHKSEILKANFDNVKLSAGEALSEGLTDGMDSLLDNMDDIETAVTGFFGAIGKIIGGGAELLPGAIETVTGALESVGGFLTPIFDAVAENPQAAATALEATAAAIVAFKVGNAIANIGDASSVLGGLFTALSNPWVVAAAAFAAGTVILVNAVNDYNSVRLENSFAEAFGDVELSAQQARQAAESILGETYNIPTMEIAIENYEFADDVHEKAEAKLKENDALEWLTSCGIKLDTEQQGAYITNIDEYLALAKKELESRTFAANLSVEAHLGQSEEGQQLQGLMSEWTKEDMSTFSTLSAELTTAVQTALEDGVINVDEQSVIDMLQTKINNITAGWKASEAQAQLDLLEMNYGSYSGAQLTEESYQQVVESLNEILKTQDEQRQAESLQFFETLEGFNTNPERAAQLAERTGMDVDAWKNYWSQAMRNEEASGLIYSSGYQQRTMEGTYGEQLAANTEESQANIEKYMSTSGALGSALASNDWEGVQNALSYGGAQAMVGGGWDVMQSADQNALDTLYETMKPSTQAMEQLISEYQTEGQKIPKELADAYSQAIQTGANSGDMDAANQIFANQMVGDEGLMKAIQDGLVTVPEEMKPYYERALALTADNLTDEPLDLQTVQAKIDSVKLDENGLTAGGEELYKQIQGLAGTGSTTMLDGGQVGVEYEVTSGDTLWHIAGQLTDDPSQIPGLVAQIAQASGIAEGQEGNLEVGQKIVIPEDLVTVEGAENVGAAVQEEVDAQTKEGGATTSVDVTLGSGETDTTQVVAGAQTDLDTAFDTTLGTDGDAKVTLDQENNSSEVYSQVESELQTQFNSTMGISANATVSINWAIANPSKTINFDGGSGSVTITAHKYGGFFAEPHLGMVAEAGPEWIIPEGDTDMLAEAAESMGIGLANTDMPTYDYKFSGPNMAAYGMSGGGSGQIQKSQKDINLNITGGGSINVQGMTAEQVVAIIQERLRPILLELVASEDAEEGMLAYEY